MVLATCNPYVSSISSAKLPATTHEAANVSPGDINVGRDLRPKYSYGYISQGTTQPVEDTKPSNANKRSMGITPLNIMPTQNMPDKVIPDNYVNFNEASPLMSGPKTVDLDNHPEISKKPNEVSSTKYQHKPFSETFNNFRENLLKTMDLDLKSKSRSTSPLKNVKTNDAAAINLEATFVEPQLKTLTTQPIQLTDSLPQVLPNNYNNMLSGPQNERTLGKNAENAEEFKDYTFDAENIPANRAQVSRVSYSNSNPFFQISKENKFGKLNPKGQQQEIKYNTPNVKQQSKMQPLKIPPYKPQENSSYFTTIVPTNQNLLPPYNEERNLTQTLRIPNKNQINPIDSEALYSQLISDNEKIRANQLKTDPRTLQVPISRMPYYQNSKSLLKPNNESLQENPIVTMDPSSSSKLNMLNTLPYYSFADKIIPLAQPNFTNLNLEENISEVSNPGIIFNSSTKEENISYPFRAPYYNNFYQPYTRSYFGQQLFPRNHSSTLNQLEKVDPQHYSEEGNVVEKAHIAANPQEINSVVTSPDIIITTKQTSNNEDENILQNFAPPYNLYRPYSRSFNQQIKPDNQSLKYEDNASKTYSMNIPVDRNVPKKSQTNPEIIPSESPEVVYQPENLHNDTENVSKSLQTTPPYYNEFYQPFSRAHSQQLMPRNHSPKLNEQEKAEPQNNNKEGIVLQMTTNFQKNNSVFAYPETILRTEQTSNNKDENVTQNSPPPYYNRPYSRAFNQQIKLGNQSLTYEEQTRKADPMFLFSERNVPQSTNNVSPNAQIIPSGSPEIISQPEQNLHNEEKNESKILKTPYNNNFYQPFSRAFGSQLQSSDHLLKEKQFSNATSNNGAEKTETSNELNKRTYENTLDPSLKTSNITSAQILQEDHILVKTDQISLPELDVKGNLQNKNAESGVLQMSKPLQKSLPQVPISEVSKGAPIKKERNEFQVFKEPYNKNLDPFNSLTINPQSSTENQLVKAEPDINVKHNIIPYNIDESVSQMQPLSEFSPHIIQQNLTESPEDNSLSILPTVNNYNLLDNIIQEGLPSTELSSQLPFQTQENLPELIQQIEFSENMRTKNAIATPVYNLGAKTKCTQSSHNAKLLENRDQISRVSYFDRLNPFNSRGSIQQAAPYNQIINENKQIPKPNQNILSQNTNNYNIPNNEFSNKNEALGLLLIPQQHNKKSLPIKYILGSNSDDEKMDNEVTKSFGALDSKNLNPSYNGGIPGYDSQNTKVPYYNSFNPFISNKINKQTLPSSQRMKVKPTESLDQDLPTKEYVNNALHNDKGTESDSEILKINIPLQFQEKPQDPPTSDVFDSQGKAKVKNEIIQYSDTLEPTTQQYAFSQDIRRVEYESQANGISCNNSSQPYNANELNQQLSYDNQKQYEDNSSKLIIRNQNTMPKLDININIPNSEDVCKNNPLEITITEKPNKACPGKINDNIAQNIIIDINNGNENFCKCLNLSQKCDKITSIGDFIPCLTEESNVTKENNCTKTTVESSEFKEIVPSIDLNNFSSYLADTILSAVQSFLVQPNCSSLNNIVAKNNFDIVNIKNSVCNCSQIKIPLQNILEPVNNTNESAVPLLNIKEESNHSAIKYQCPGTLQKDEVKTDTLLKATPCLEPNLASQEEQSNKASEILCPALNKTIVNNVTGIQYNKTEPNGMTKDSCICTNKTLQIPPHIDNNPYSDRSNADGNVLETDSKTHIICTSTNKTRQVLQNDNENPPNVNTNEITTSHQSPQVLLPYYYYVDHTNVTSSDTEPIPKPISRPSNTSEEEKSVVICQENDTETIPTVIYDKPEEVEKTYHGPKPCLSKITVNIMPIVDKSNHDILVFI
ncbi:uncharacterized protein LOC121739719 isoform X2 [Aricia agestis]|uniref:uncharacterized protein LOC121739719 isoform X2 n=1 Tax=Aricia agestis TaxID=91739 RepID=UPI001C208A40|nr:uncharacterized protein LOC121739719 isoform X2 [Aricia agestis]